MLTIIKKELKSYFNSPLAYVLLVIFLGLTNFFYFKNILLSGVSTLRPMFSLLPWFLLFFVPALSMGLLSKEKESGTLEILATQSIKPKNIILGKFFGTLIFVCIAILLTLIVPITLSGAGDFDIGIVFSQYLGSIFLVAGFTALGLFASSITKNSIISFILGIAFNFIFIIIGFEMVILSLPGWLGIFLNNLSIFGHYDSIARGVIDLKDLLYFILLIGIFIYASLFLFNKQFISRKNKKYVSSLIILICLIVVTVVINLWGNFLRVRLDLTSGQVYTLSSSTKTILQNLNKKIELDFFVSKDMPAQIASQVQDVRDLLSDYKKYGHGNVVLNIYYPDASDEAKTKAQQFNIPPLQFNVVEQDAFQVKQGWLGLALSITDQEQSQSTYPATIPFIQRTDNLEYQISSLIWQMTNENKKDILFLTGHGEKSLFSEMSYLNQELSKSYNVDEVNLIVQDTKNKKTLQPIATSTSVIVLAGANEPFTEAELSEIKNFLRAGGGALVLGSQINVDTQFLTATSTQSNLNDVMADYGLKFEDNLVYDLKSNETVTMGQGNVNFMLPYPFWISALGNTNSEIIKNQQTIVLPWANEISILDSIDDQEFSIVPLFATTDAGGEQILPAININPQQNFSVQNLKSRLVAVGVKKGSSRLIAIGNSQFITDSFVQNSTENLNFALNAIEWLAQDEILSAIRSKNLDSAPLIFSSDSNKNFIKYFNIAGLPIIIALFGAGWLVRRRKISKRKYEE
ncbi:MAG: Gldg family protein [Patescibacteria group bacterium]